MKEQTLFEQLLRHERARRLAQHNPNLTVRQRYESRARRFKQRKKKR